MNNILLTIGIIIFCIVCIIFAFKIVTVLTRTIVLFAIVCVIIFAIFWLNPEEMFSSISDIFDANVSNSSWRSFFPSDSESIVNQTSNVTSQNQTNTT